MRPSVIAGAALLALGLARPAPAQEWRGFISASGGYQTTAREFVDNVTFTAYAEQGEFDVRYNTPAAPLFDISGGARFWPPMPCTEAPDVRFVPPSIER